MFVVLPPIFNLAVAAGAIAIIGIGLDSTTGFDHYVFANSQAAVSTTFGPVAAASYLPQLGLHFIQALEWADGTNTATFVGGPNPFIGSNPLRQALEVGAMQ